MTLTKSELIETVHRSSDLKKTQAARAFFAVLEIMKNSLERGEDVLISGFGKFSLKVKMREEEGTPQRGTI